MTIESKITVGNNSQLGYDTIRVSTPCIGFISIFVPVNGGKNELEIELRRSELSEFLIRTQPTLRVELIVDATKTTRELPQEDLK